MKLLIIEEYKNIFDYVDLDVETIENKIQNYELNFSNIKNDIVEWKMKFPMFLNSFYKKIYQSNTIPTQTEFWADYLMDNLPFFEKNKYGEDIMNALKARAFRTYPSLVRDLHFMHYVKENINESKVIYNRKLDINEGIDLLIVRDNLNYGINLFTATSRSFEGRSKKENRHKKYDNINYINLPVHFKGSYVCGKFFLYKEDEYGNLLNELDNYTQ
jgi:hypothetical protein